MHRLKEKKPLFSRHWFWYIIFIVIIFLTLFYFFIFYNTFQISNIIISNSENINNENIKNTIVEKTNHKLLNIAGNTIFTKSIFLVKKNEIQQNILGNFPEISEVFIKTKLPNTLLVDINNRTSIAEFCINKEKNKCFLIDKNGIIFKESTTNKSTYLTIIKNILESEIALGQKIIDPNNIEKLLVIQNNTNEATGEKVEEIILENNTKIIAKTSSNLRIFLTFNADIESQVLKLLLLVNDLGKEELDKIRYVDLRYKDRAVVCNNEECCKDE